MNTNITIPEALNKLDTLHKVPFKEFASKVVAGLESPKEQKAYLALCEYYSHYTFCDITNDLQMLIALTSGKNYYHPQANYFFREILEFTTGILWACTGAKNDNFPFIFSDLAERFTLSNLKNLDTFWNILSKSDQGEFMPWYYEQVSCLKRVILKYISLEKGWDLEEYFEENKA